VRTLVIPRAGWDAELGLFDRDRPATGFPVQRLGCTEVARVTGSRTTAVREGDVVAMPTGTRRPCTAIR
jgi:hypothetical protein